MSKREEVYRLAETPIAKVFSTYGSLLQFGDRFVGDFITSFSYEYAEDGDDLCEIVLEFEDEENLNYPFLTEDSELYVQWGTIGKLGPKKLVVIRDSKTSYTVSGIRLTLKCTDKASYLKTVTAKSKEGHINVGSLTSWLANLSYDKLDNIRIKLSIPHQIEETYSYDKYPSRPTNKDVLNSNQTSARDNTAVAHQKPLLVASATIWAVLNKEIKELEGGPYVLDGSDDQLHIRTRNFDAEYIKHYQVRRDPRVISFEPKTNIRKGMLEISNVAQIDPSTGDIEEEHRVYTNNLIRIKNHQERVKELIDPNYDMNLMEILQKDTAQAKQDSLETQEKDIDEPLYEEIDKLTEELTSRMERKQDVNEAVYELIEDQYIVIDEESAKRHDLTKEGDEVIEPEDLPEAPPHLISDESGKLLFAPYAQKHWEELSKTSKTRRVKIPRQRIFHSPLFKDALHTKVTNAIKDDLAKMYEASMEVAGDVDLVTNRMILISGRIKNAHKGPYYISKARHAIIPKKAYITSLSLMLKPDTDKWVEQKLTSKLDFLQEGEEDWKEKQDTEQEVKVTE